MRLIDALPILENACNKPFGVLFAGHPDDLRTNKGHAGQLLERYIGLTLNSGLCDFDDGELKTNKSAPDSSPLETMFITQISNQIDTLVSSPHVSFENSHLFQKIKNLVYLPVVKRSENPSDWYYTRCIHIEIHPGSRLFDKIKEDYNAICDGLRHHITAGSDGQIHTTNGPHYIQVRSKDAKRKSTGAYNPIYSNTFGRQVSNKNHAFYFKTKFMTDAISGRLDA